MATQRIGNNRITDGEVTGPKLGVNSIGANNFTSAANTYITGLASSNPTVTAAFNHANAVFLQSNNNVGVDLTQNTSIASSFVHANAAFLSSNTYALTNDGVNTTQNASVAAAFTRANNSLNANTGGVVGGATTFSGNLTVVGDTSITGNLFVSGNTVSISSGSIVANDSLIILGINNYTADIVDIGFAGHYNDGTNAHSGLIRDTGTKEWHLFKGYTPEIGSTNNINLADGSYAVDTLNANLKAPTSVLIKTVNILDQSNAAFLRANNSLDANNGGTVSGPVVYNGPSASLTLNGSPLAVRANLNIQSVTETANIVSTAIGGNTILYIANNSSYYFAANPTANITFDLRANSQNGGTLDNYLGVGQMISVGIMLSQGATAYRANLFIDGVLQTANTRWSGNVNPASGGTINGIDVYSFSVLKRGANSYIILASNTAFANGATSVY